MDDFDDYSFGNADSHWFKLLVPVAIVTFCNIFIFTGFWCMRAVANVRFNDHNRAKQKANSLPEQQEYHEYPKVFQRCMDDFDDYSFGNADSHWFKLLVPVAIVTFCNIFIFTGFWYMRAVANVRFNDHNRAKQKANSLPAQQEYHEYPTDTAT